jgi:copper chaperone
MTQTLLTVPDISCGHCERTIKNALTTLTGVQQVAVNIAAKQVQVEYDATQVTLDQLKQTLADEEYPVAAVSEPSATSTETPPSASTGCACCTPADHQPSNVTIHA